MELWDLYDINRQKIHKTHIRGESIEENTYHLVVSVCVFNSKNEMLIQQRQHDKNGWPNKWDITAAGSAISGESSQDAAKRELFEEIGLNVEFTDKRPIISVNFSRGFQDYYCVLSDVDLKKLKLQKEEVQAVKWANKSTIFNMIDSEEFIPYYKSLISVLFDMKSAAGSHKINDFK